MPLFWSLLFWKGKFPMPLHYTVYLHTWKEYLPATTYCFLGIHCYHKFSPPCHCRPFVPCLLLMPTFTIHLYMEGGIVLIGRSTTLLFDALLFGKFILIYLVDWGNFCSFPPCSTHLPAYLDILPFCLPFVQVADSTNWKVTFFLPLFLGAVPLPYRLMSR